MSVNERIKKALSILVCICMLLLNAPVSALAAAADTLYEEHAEGSGNEGLTATIDTGAEVTIYDTDGDGFYEISNADELYAFAALVNSGRRTLNVKLTADITINEKGKAAIKLVGYRDWTPIGDYEGTFDGANHCIYGMSVVKIDTRCAGMFRTVVGGTVKNLGMKDSYFYADSDAGAIVGENRGTVANCYTFDTMVAAFGGAGGLVGYNRGTVTNCCNSDGWVSAIIYTGGIVGRNSGTVMSCRNHCRYVGGEAYWECLAAGYVGFFSSANEQTEYSGIGGIAGENSGTVTDCYNTGGIVGTHYVGGVVGVNTGAVTNCYSTGYTGAGFVGIQGFISEHGPEGPIVSFSDGTVSNCYYNNGSGEGTYMSNSRFASGEVTYLLNGDQTNIVWYQTCGQGAPAFSGQRVYQVCDGEKLFYSNTDESTHIYDNTCDTTCNFCGGVREITHTYGDWTADGGGTTHSKVCSVCGDTVAEDHTGGTATCAALARCQVCGTGYGEKDPNNHDSTVAYENGFCPSGCIEAAVDSDGDGVYEIANAGNLYWFAEQVNGGNAAISGILTADITVNPGVMSEGSTDVRAWTPMGNAVVQYQYTGTFDGAGHTVKGLYCSTEDTCVGLFGYVGSSGRVQNLSVADSYICGGNAVGGVAGWNEGTVTGCSYSGTVSGGNINVGGIAGRNDGTVSNCCSIASVSASGDAGGVVGGNYGGTVTNCCSQGSVSGEFYAGGVVGYSYKGSISGCYHAGTVTAGDFAGGVAGDVTQTTVSNCYYLDDSETVLGGICGADVTGSAEARNSAAFSSGEVAYLLQGSQTEPVWGQTVGTQPLPVLGGETVYPATATGCKEAKVYANTEDAKVAAAHINADGVCIVCGQVSRGSGTAAGNPATGDGFDLPLHSAMLAVSLAALAALLPAFRKRRQA